uniref:Antitoxin HicB n=1 Tax=Candidatus Kentrum sp. LPFa TaxID=2126335 RepID=A0A450X3K5_9GAMM|nr:MAG: antitoxin HicB [Candidatus Kentron sp. LPFa]VFK35549.1 MAG: antitoxin HicB [Candidatus Kentron sp. LPFa]
MLYKIPLVLAPQTEGGFTVTSPILPELVTERDSIKEVLANVQDALLAVIEAYRDLGRSCHPVCNFPTQAGPYGLKRW